jgi:hypothetical protein
MLRWTEEEKKVLKEIWENPDISFDDAAKILKSRTTDSIKKKAAALGLGSKNLGEPDIDYEYLKSLVTVKDI